MIWLTHGLFTRRLSYANCYSNKNLTLSETVIEFLCVNKYETKKIVWD